MNSYFKVLYTTYYKRVYSTCFLILKNHYLAEESAQEAFIKAYKNIDKLKDASKFGAWVAVIASRCAIDIYRDNQKVVAIEDNDLLEKFIIQKTNNYIDPYDELENLELSKEMRLAITKLTPPANQIIILKFYWQLKDQEIADMLEKPLGTIKSSLHRSKGTLSKILPSINKDYLKLIEGDK
ncbi:RNA polymerase sigma-70 factor, ECF subfamily [Desulfonispora thiosulfatigenes DSM 11270]|uniref:RNA polymerase sigma-70 factor, ECF subfamily n=1 Tax=Desulfonispora thiosulfatigenes DSM 11270 TaxID=656914 RepID=A0A1W1UY89_DESTI|nr:RNA polymerase sigma factor [Desulfonispora thiosulfatigenes]SMB86085.1 RNA polymerase sigma-70 factor, ECF subfamily [Desulfonispora thiosulfatigenes DSM 11270]